MATIVIRNIRWESRQEQLPDTARIFVDLEIFPLHWRTGEGKIRKDFIEFWAVDELENYYHDICTGFSLHVEYA